MVYDPTLITGSILFPMLCGQISAGIGYNPGFFGLETGGGNKQLSPKESHKKTWVNFCCNQTSQDIIYIKILYIYIYICIIYKKIYIEREIQKLTTTNTT